MCSSSWATRRLPVHQLQLSTHHLDDQPEEDITKTLDHRKYTVEVNRSFIMNEGSPSGFLSWLDLMRVYPWNWHLRQLNDATLFNSLVLGVILSLQLLNRVHHVLHVFLDTGMQGPVTEELHFATGTTWTVLARVTAELITSIRDATMLPVSSLIKLGFSQESGTPENENR